jgi:predicted metal-dependent enzyme (double-stranded beta helix superfamily)
LAALATVGTEENLLGLCRVAVATGDEVEIAAILKDGLFDLARREKLGSIGYAAPRTDRYSRRLVYSDPWARFVVVAMTWGPGQQTPLHDQLGHCRFEQRETVVAPPASAGALIPPFEHHIFGNTGQEVAHTLHVYGGPMNRCDIFHPLAEGWWQRLHRVLRYDE